MLVGRPSVPSVVNVNLMLQRSVRHLERRAAADGQVLKLIASVGAERAGDRSAQMDGRSRCCRNVSPMP